MTVVTGSVRCIAESVADVTSSIVARYGAALDASPEIVVVARIDGLVLWMNEAARRSLDAEAIGRRTLDLIDDRERDRVADILDRVVQRRGVRGEMVRMRRRGGDDRWYLWSGEILEDEMLLFGRDVTDERRERELVAGEQWIMRAVLRGRPFAEISREACETVRRLIPECGCSVKAVVPESGSLRLVASAGLPENLLGAIEETPLDAVGGGGRAAALGRSPVPTDDVARDSRWALLREWAIGAGVRSHWVGPLIDDSGAVVGALSLHFRRDRAPREWETAIGRRLATTLALAAVFDRDRRLSAGGNAGQPLVKLPKRNGLVQ